MSRTAERRPPLSVSIPIPALIGLLMVMGGQGGMRFGGWAGGQTPLIRKVCTTFKEKKQPAALFENASFKYFFFLASAVFLFSQNFLLSQTVSCKSRMLIYKNQFKQPPYAAGGVTSESSAASLQLLNLRLS